MTKSKRAADNPPECLRKKGITHCTDNLDGRELSIGKQLWLFFGPELRERFLRPRSAKPETRDPEDG